MSWFDGLRHRLRTLTQPEEFERELRDEMRFHEELDTAQQHDAARARRRFGNRTYYQEETRRMTWWGRLDVPRQDLTYAWRSIRRTPGFTAMVVLTLALGVGANAAMFTFLDRIFVRSPAGVSDAASIRRLWIERHFSFDREPAWYQSVNYPWYVALKTAAGKTADIAWYNTDDGLHLGRNNASAPVHGVFATANYFDVLGVRPAFGRFYGPDEDRMGAGANVAVVSHQFWRTRLGGDSAIVGKPLHLGKTKYTVIGVAEPRFAGLDVQSADVWMPMGAFQGRLQNGKPWWQTQTTYGSVTIVRAKAGFDDREFAARATVAIRRADRELDAARADSLLKAMTGSIVTARGPGHRSQDVRIATRLAGVSAIVLLIACANVINLLLARALRRRREIAVRLALGISRSRLVRLLTTETLLLALLAAGAAIAVAWWGGGLLRSLLFPHIEWTQSPVDWRVVVFTVGLGVAAGLVAGLIPALQSINPGLTKALKAGEREGGAQRSLLRSSLLIVQAAMSVVLLVGAALFVRSLQNVRSIDLGFDQDRLLFAEMRFEEGEAPSDTVVAEQMRLLAQRLRGRPGVEYTTRAQHAPTRGYGAAWFYFGADSARSLRPDPPGFAAASTDFFKTTGMPFVRGATFSGDDILSTVANRHELVVNEAAARAMWPNQDPMGQCVWFHKRASPCYRVVGIVKTAKKMSVIEKPLGQMYAPLGSDATADWFGVTLLVRADPEAMKPLQAEVHSALKRAFPLGYPTVMSLSENLDRDYLPWRLSATLFTAFGLLALVVALVGIYSTMAYSVGQRTHEFGVRIALGARVRDVVNLVLGEGLRVVVLGVVLGIALALAAGRLIASLLYGVESTDTTAMLVAALTLLGVAALAAFVPAWRAAKVDPVTALRAD